MKALFSLYLGALDGVRLEADQVSAVVGRSFDSFTLIPGEGRFRGTHDPGWGIRIATNALPQLVELAAALRREFRQDGVGIEAGGHYFRCTAETRPAKLAAELRAALPARSPARKPFRPEAWVLLRENQRDDMCCSQQWTDHVRLTSDEHFAWGQSGDGDIEEVDSGSALWIAGYLMDIGYLPADLDNLAPEFDGLRQALTALTDQPPARLVP